MREGNKKEKNEEKLKIVNFIYFLKKRKHTKDVRMKFSKKKLHGSHGHTHIHTVLGETLSKISKFEQQ